MIRISVCIILLQCLLTGAQWFTGAGKSEPIDPPLAASVYGINQQCKFKGFHGGACTNNWKDGELNCSTLCCAVKNYGRPATMDCNQAVNEGTHCSTKYHSKVCFLNGCREIGLGDIPHQPPPKMGNLECSPADILD